MKKLSIILTIFFLTAILLVATQWMLREHWSFSREIVLANGKVRVVRESGSEYRYFGHPHVFGFGGGGLWQKLEFKQGDSQYKWEGSFIPICLQFDDKTPVLIVFDRETDFSHITFRYFRHEQSRWNELPLTQFPRSLALQNLWLKSQNGYREGRHINEFEIVKKLDPNDIDFQVSLTANVWFCIEKNKQYWQLEHGPVDSAFLADYKARHMQSKESSNPS